MRLHYFSLHQAVAKQPIEPQTKLVLYTILNHFSGSGVYLLPGFKTLVADSGLDRETFITHLRRAHKHGFSDITWQAMEQINEQ